MVNHNLAGKIGEWIVKAERKGKKHVDYTDMERSKKEIKDVFLKTNISRRVIDFKRDKIDNSRKYQVFRDKEDWKEFILIYFENQSIPVKCKKYEEGVNWFAYKITPNNPIQIWYYKHGEAKDIINCKINIIEEPNNSYPTEDIVFDEHVIYHGDIKDIEDEEDPEEYMRRPKWNPFEEEENFDDEELDKIDRDDPF